MQTGAAGVTNRGLTISEAKECVKDRKSRVETYCMGGT